MPENEKELVERPEIDESKQWGTGGCFLFWSDDPAFDKAIKIAGNIIIGIITLGIWHIVHCVKVRKAKKAKAKETAEATLEEL